MAYGGPQKSAPARLPTIKSTKPQAAYGGGGSRAWVGHSKIEIKHMEKKPLSLEKNESKKDYWPSALLYFWYRPPFQKKNRIESPSLLARHGTTALVGGGNKHGRGTRKKKKIGEPR